MNIILWILFGLLVGVVASSIGPSTKISDISRSLLLGVVGALAGGLVANFLFKVTLAYFNFNAFLLAIAGSLILLFLGKTVRKA